MGFRYVLNRVVTSLLAGIILASPLASVELAYAAANLMPNNSVEAATGSNPSNWTTNKWGTNAATFSYENTGYTGTRSLKVSMTSRSSGDAKWMHDAITVTPNTTYTYGDYYKANVDTELDIQFIDSSGRTTNQYIGTIPASTTWRQYTKTFTTPSTARKLVAFHIIYKVGYLQTDEYALAQGTSLPNPNPVPPTVSITAPTAGATLSGVQAITATASDDQSVASVQFTLDGNALGSPDTASPYAISWDTATATNGSHTLAAMATDNSGLTTTSAGVAVQIQNVAPIPPTVSITAPSANAVVSGVQAITATASDDQSVASVQFRLDGVNLGALDVTAPYAISWDTATATNGSHVVTALATDNTGLVTTSAAITVQVQNTVNAAPVVTITAPINGATVSAQQTIVATATDDQGVASVQFKVDGVTVGPVDTEAPYSVAWDTTSAANGSHTLSAIATDGAGLATTASVTVSVQNYTNTAPTVSLTAPAAGSTLSGVQTVTAAASDDHGVAGVQFKLDGVNLGAIDTTTPYSVSWDTLAAANGAHTLTAVATDTDGVATTATAVTVSVQNIVSTPNNLMPNYSVENGSGVVPANWSTNKWGTNSATFTYENEGYTGAKSLKIAMTSWASGDAKWMHDPVTITGGQTYTYRDFYKSSVSTELDVQFIDANGNTSVTYMGTIPASSTWTSYTKTFTAPASARKMVAFHIIYKVGSLQTDEYALVQGSSIPNPTPVQIPPTVSVTAPASGVTVNGRQTITATASDDKGIASVQFKVDGANLGAADTSAPYSAPWDTTALADGSHAVVAVATDTEGLSTTSAGVTVIVQNTTTPPPQNGPVAFPVKISSNGRYLVDQNDQPFFYTADTSWTMLSYLSVADAKTLIDIRKSQGFNTIQTILTPFNITASGPRGAPFAGTDITQPNASYWTGVDEIMTYAQSQGMLLYAVPLWMANNGGWGCEDGDCVPAPSTSAMATYMTWVGNRYKNQSNLIWVMGGDDETFRNAAVKQAGAQALDAADPNHLMTYHPRWDEYGFANESWYDFYAFQKNDITAPYNYVQIRTAMGLSPTRPVLDAEPPYEPGTAIQGDGATADPILNRRFGWWAATSGALGVAYGGPRGSWAIGKDGAPNWAADIQRPQAGQTGNIQKIMSPLPWQKLVPDWSSATVTAGRGTYGGVDYATAGRASDGSLIVAFAPSARTFTVNLAQLSGVATAQWYDPVSGLAVGTPQTVTNSGTQTFATPGTNAGNATDWVLVIKAN